MNKKLPEAIHLNTKNERYKKYNLQNGKEYLDWNAHITAALECLQLGALSPWQFVRYLCRNKVADIARASRWKSDTNQERTILTVVNCSARNDKTPWRRPCNRKAHFWSFYAHTTGQRLNCNLHLLCNSGEKIAVTSAMDQCAALSTFNFVKDLPYCIHERSSNKRGVRNEGIHSVTLLRNAFKQGAV